MSGWKAKPWFIFDTETTGLDVEQDRICQLGGLWMQSGEMTDRHLVTINPGVPIPKEASNTHGITDERVAGAPTFSDVFPRLLEHFERAEVVAFYNGTTFDWPLVVAECRRADAAQGWPAGHDGLAGPESREFQLHEATTGTLFVDVLTQVRRRSVGCYWPGKGRHRLESVGRRLRIQLPLGMRLHRADADCYLTGRILWETCDKLPDDARECGELLDRRGREQEEDFQRWLSEQKAKEAS